MFSKRLYPPLLSAVLLSGAFIPTPALAADGPHVVYFATDRAENVETAAKANSAKHCKKCISHDVRYGPYRADLSFGRAKLSPVVKNSKHRINFTVGRIDKLDSIPVNDGARIIIFVHGAFSTFNEYVQVTDTIRGACANEYGARDDARPIIPILYSWPSMGSPFAYMQDESTVEWSYPHFRNFMDDLHKRIAGRDIQVEIVTHSMGGRLAYRYLIERSNDAPFVQNVVLSSPDIDYEMFRQQSELDRLSRSVSGHVTVLLSNADVPLEWSRSFHGYTRLGRPWMSSPKSVFLGTFRTGSVANIAASTVHAPFMIGSGVVRFTERRIKGITEEEDWRARNNPIDAEFPKNIELVDFTAADKILPIGHSICPDVIASYLVADAPPANYREEATSIRSDEYRECNFWSFKCTNPFAAQRPVCYGAKKLVKSD